MSANMMDEPELKALAASIHRSPIPTLVTDNRIADNPIVDVNQAFQDLTGYPRDEIIGRNCRLLNRSDSDSEGRSELRSAVAEGRPTIVELTNYRKDGTAFLNAVMIAPVLDASGAVAMFIGSQMEVAGADTGSALRRANALKRVSALSPRLRQTLELVASGYRNKQIGGRLGIEEKTVKMHRARLLQALGVDSTAEAIRIAVEAGLPPSDPG